MEELVDYVMESPFADALPAGTYSNNAVGTLRIKTRYRAPAPLTAENETFLMNRDVKKFNDGLFADDCWPGAVVLSDYLASNPGIVANKRVLEFGAGAALPSLV